MGLLLRKWWYKGNGGYICRGGENQLLISQDMIPLTCNKPLYLNTHTHKCRLIPCDSPSTVLSAVGNRQVSCGSQPLDAGPTSCWGGKADCTFLFGDPPSPSLSSGWWEPRHLASSEGMTEVSLFFFLTDKQKDESIKKKGPYKIFFKDLFIFKDSEKEDRKKVWFY